MTALVDCLPKVEHIAKRFAKRLPPHYELDDLVQDGMVGLLDAASRYDDTRGATLATFAGKRIHGAILDGLRRNDPLCKQERQKRRSFVADEQLDAAAVDYRFAAPEVDVYGIAWVRRRLREIAPRDRFVLTGTYYGEVDDATMARVMGVSPGRISQIRLRALRRLRRAATWTS